MLSVLANKNRLSMSQFVNPGYFCEMLPKLLVQVPICMLNDIDITLMNIENGIGFPG